MAEFLYLLYIWSVILAAVSLYLTIASWREKRKYEKEAETVDNTAFWNDLYRNLRAVPGTGNAGCMDN